MPTLDMACRGRLS